MHKLFTHIFILTWIKKSWPDILVNVASDFVTIILIALISTLIYISLKLLVDRELNLFFGLIDKKEEVSILLSRIEVQRNGTVGLTEMGRGFVGSAITKLEYDGAAKLKHILDDRLAAYLSRRINVWLSSASLSINKTKVNIDTGIPFVDKRDLLAGQAIVRNQEDKRVEIERMLGSEKKIFILLGSSRYNLLTSYYLNFYLPEYSQSKMHCFYEHRINEGRSVIGIKENGKYKIVKSNDTKERVEYGFVQRVNDRRNKSSVFICAGLGSRATKGSAEFLSKHWKQLRREFKSNSRVDSLFGGNREFSILLEFKPQDSFSTDNVTPEMIFVYPESFKSSIEGFTLNQ